MGISPSSTEPGLRPGHKDANLFTIADFFQCRFPLPPPYNPRAFPLSVHSSLPTNPPMKCTHARQNQSPLTGSDCSESDVASSSPDWDEQQDATYKMDVTEPDITKPDDRLSLRKRLRSDDEADDFYNNPLNDTGIDLCEINKDFDKAEGTIKRRERIKT
ncbi:uncharacterized protein P174DRAFT_507752 [Aspergillus novofumigatus IBT 16806]|uniref:Uncharacterized protein n=1 Tax=Aspergillus novofumigatus (strain IBT 16806) TaxID=1392255 RepID=A0A2I1BU19_ASPN1|nr:uncharacterized protein P174DRAFT_507752 [Aspergillus novofumigatus IBT 16806]PKX88869.1 hypothetical protein P174DRAFT_507752 [Aspergillus novofumigatus IBT 16806]